MARKQSNDPNNPRAKPERKEAKHGRLAVFQAAAVDDSRVSPAMLAVLAALSTHSSRSGYIDVSHAALAARLGVKRQYVQRTLAVFETLGYLKSVRRRRSSDQGETTKAYKLNLDYTLPVQYWRYVPSDYGAEPEEDWFNDPFTTLPPATTIVAPPATTIVAPPATTIVAPPATIVVAPRTLGINDRLLDGVDNALAREKITPTSMLEPEAPEAEPSNPPQAPAPTLAAQVAAAAHLPPSTNLEVLAMLLEAYAPTMTPAQLVIAATDCAQWYADNRDTCPRLGNLSEWLRREEKRRQTQAAEEVTNHGTPANDPAHDTNGSAAARVSERGRPRGAGSGQPARTRQTTRARGASPRAEHTEPGDPFSEWTPGHRVYVPDDASDPECEWYTVVTERGRRVRYSTVTGYVNPAEAYDSDQPDQPEPGEHQPAAAAVGLAPGADARTSGD